MELSQTNLIAGLIGLIMFPPAEDIPSPADIPPGTIIPPGAVIPPGTVFPPGSTSPRGVPRAPGWGEVLPPSIITPPVYPPGGVMPGPGPRTAPPCEGDLKGTKLIAYETTITGNDSDGNIDNWDSTFALARNQVENPTAYDHYPHRNKATLIRWNDWGIEITRSFFDFDLSSIPAGAIITAVSLVVQGYVQHDTQVTIQQGTQHIPLVDADFDNFSGVYFGKITWDADAGGVPVANTFTFNAAGIAYIQSVVAGTAKLCMRDYDYDSANHDPGGTGYDHENGCYYADTGSADSRPKITISYKA